MLHAPARASTKIPACAGELPRMQPIGRNLGVETGAGGMKRDRRDKISVGPHLELSLRDRHDALKSPAGKNKAGSDGGDITAVETELLGDIPLSERKFRRGMKP